MKKCIDDEELKRIELNLLVDVDRICKENGFRYSLGGGTLLGAVRHKGFIPWDDDIDIMMPRPDYDAFISYCLNNDVRFGICSYETDKSFTDLSAKIYDKNTIIEDENISDFEKQIGVSIDVFPIDGLADTYDDAKKAFHKTDFKRSLLVAAAWKHFFRSKTHTWYYEPIRFAFFLMSRFINKQKSFEKILKTYSQKSFDECKYVAAVGGSYREKEILPIELYKESVELEFEDKKFNAISGYREYLQSIYGDYMQLPPEEKRVAHHTFKAYYINCDNESGDKS